MFVYRHRYKRFASSIVVLLAAACFPSCSNAQGDKLGRPTALRILQKSGGLKNEITADANTVVEWEEVWWGRGTSYDQHQLYAQGDLDFHNRLVEVGVLRKKPDQVNPCNSVPGSGEICEGRKFLDFNFAVIPSADVRVTFPGQIMNSRSIEFGTVVLARASDPKVTGITQEGTDAVVEIEFGYAPTSLYKNLLPLIQRALSICSVPELSSNPPQYCGHWPSEAEIRAKKESGSLNFRKYDDGWRIVSDH